MRSQIHFGQEHLLDEIGHAREPLLQVQRIMLQHGAESMHVAADGTTWLGTRRNRHLLVLGPPQSGKTSAVIVPAILSHPGPVVAASTQVDVVMQTGITRSLMCSPATDVWVFDPTGSQEIPAGARELRWSPVTGAREWDGALAIASAMVGAVSRENRDARDAFWTERAGKLLAAFLHAAAVGGLSMRDVMTEWVLGQDGESALQILASRGSAMAHATLKGLLAAHDDLSSSMFQSVSNAVEAYVSDAALVACDDPNFNANRFVRSYPASQPFVCFGCGDELVPNLQGVLRAASTLYILAPRLDQERAAPLIVGLLAEIREAAYRLHRERALSKDSELMPPVLFALDEMAHIAPMDDLPSSLAEGGSRGVLIMGCVQDLSQVRHRWGARADGFLTLFGDALILPGIADDTTLSLLTKLAGNYDRKTQSTTQSSGSNAPVIPFPHGFGRNKGRSTQESTSREPLLPPDAIYAGPNRRRGDAYLLQGGGFLPVFLTPYYSTSPWPELLVRATEHAVEVVSGRESWWTPSYRPHLLLPTPRLDANTLRSLGGRRLLNRWNNALLNRMEER